MPKITVLPHEELHPDGSRFEVPAGSRLCDALLKHGIEIEHACEMSCCCTRCHVIICEGFDSLRAASDEEEDQLGKAWGLEPHSRLSCQVRIGDADLTIELQRYTCNHARE